MSADRPREDSVCVACSITDIGYVRESLAEMFPDDFIAAAFDGDRALCWFDLGRVPKDERACWLEKARRVAEKAVSLHAVVRE